MSPATTTTAGRDAYARFRATRYFPALDGLRAVSILVVIWHHAAGDHARGVAGRGHLGVQLFFAISGWLITTLLLRERDDRGGISLRGFYARRTLRIFPLYYVTLGLYVVVAAVLEHGTPTGRQFFRNLPAFATYTSNWFVQLAGGARVLFYFAWSLATEEQFYALWPPVLRWARRPWVPAAFMGGLWALDAALEAAVALGLVAGGAVAVRIATSIAAPICMGSLLALAMHSPRGFARLWPLLGRAASAPLALAALAVAVAVDGTPEPVIQACMAALVAASCARPDHALVPALSNPVARHVGTVSYGMYLLHMLALNAARRVLARAGVHSTAALVVLALALTVAAATLSYRYLEQPIQKLGRRKRAPSARGGASPAAS